VPGVLYVVATPIGNLGDVSARAREILAGASVVAAEDTRHSGRLLRELGLERPLVSLHEHNERGRVAELVGRLQGGESVALVSDAGTPLVSDPGYLLVAAAVEAGIAVAPVPGPSAAIAALSASGLPCDRFCFEGFLPARAAARRQRLAELAAEARTLVLYEAPHRIAECLADLAAACGPGRRACVARELTKKFETIARVPLAGARAWIDADPDRTRGEFVLVVEGRPVEAADALDPRVVLETLLAELPLKQAVALAVKLTGGKRNELYAMALALKR
jgi:16S rRNA (cytidine1402-2'-O)-methyltransferase